MNLNKPQFTKNRNIKAETVGQSAANLIIRTIIGHDFRLFVLAQICLALSAAMPTTSNGSQALSDNATAESDMTFPADGRWSPTGNLRTARDIHTATLLPNGLVLVAGGLNSVSVESRSAELYHPSDGNLDSHGEPQPRALLLPSDFAAQRQGTCGRRRWPKRRARERRTVRSSDRNLDSHGES